MRRRNKQEERQARHGCERTEWSQQVKEGKPERCVGYHGIVASEGKTWDREMRLKKNNLIREG